MMTSRVSLSGPGGKSVVARALLDSGSSITLISCGAATAINLPVSRTQIKINGVQDTNTRSASALVNDYLSPVQVSYPKLVLTAAVVDKVTNLPLQSASYVKDLSHLQHLELADPMFHQPGKIDILLGSDILPQLVLPESRIGPPNTPIAWKTIFGWAILGPFQQPTPMPQLLASVNINQHHLVDDTPELMTRFWETEEVSQPSTPVFTPEEEAAQELFLASHHYLPQQGRYCVSLPKRPETPSLGSSRTQAVQRYLSYERAILKKKTWKQFQAVVQEYFDLGHAERVPETSLELSENVFYLPMHSVTKSSSTSTKLRVVFDASAVTSSGCSLNDILMTGPTLHPTLEDILLRFRTYPVAISADISKMYCAIELSESDRDLHRFVWRPVAYLHPGLPGHRPGLIFSVP